MYVDIPYHHSVKLTHNAGTLSHGMTTLIVSNRFVSPFQAHWLRLDRSPSRMKRKGLESDGRQRRRKKTSSRSSMNISSPRCRGISSLLTGLESPSYPLLMLVYSVLVAQLSWIA